MRTERITALMRQATDLLEAVQRHGEPILITHHGVPAAYLVDAASFESLQRRMSLLESIARGEKEIEDRRGL